jgi:hypothetical protein
MNMKDRELSLAGLVHIGSSINGAGTLIDGMLRGIRIVPATFLPSTTTVSGADLPGVSNPGCPFPL